MHGNLRGCVVIVASAGLSLAAGERSLRWRSPAPSHPARPGVLDTHLDAFRGHPLVARLDGEEIGRLTISACPPAGCAALCVDTTDPDADGTPEIEAGDVVYVGEDRPVLTHVVTGLVTEGHECPPGCVLLQLVPPVDAAAEGARPGARLTNVWRNGTHATQGGYYLIGRQLAAATASRNGRQGPNLLPGGACEGTARDPGWRAEGGSLAVCADQVPATEAHFCTEGEGALMLRSSGPAAIESQRSLRVRAGLYVLSGTIVADPGGADRVSIVGDFDRDGTVDQREALTLPFDGAFLGRAGSWPARFEMLVQIPPPASEVRVRFDHPAGSDRFPLIDDVSLRRLLPGGAHLIPDPGDRAVVVTGDSWALASLRLGDGLADGLQERLGRDVSGQVLATGRGGYTAQDLLDHWDEMVTPYRPAVVVVSVGVNEAALGGTPPETFARTLRQIEARARESNAVPVFLSVPPVGSGDVLARARALRDAQRREVLR